LIIIKALIEDTTNDNRLHNEHGLSLYIEYHEQRILFDVGGSSLFTENAKTMGVDLTKIDTVVISHGHNDHGGGLGAFLRENHIAKIYIHPQAFDPHFSKRGENLENIGLDQNLLKNPRIILIDNDYQINDETLIFSQVKGTNYYPSMNRNLYKYQNKEWVLDDFKHELNLVIKDRQNTILLIGCAHNGVINIIDHVSRCLNLKPNYVIGGFHLSSQASGTSESKETIHNIALELKKTNIQFYTGHCTGNLAFRIMKKTMGKQLQKITTGTTLIINSEEL
jgi:7,8-dihydropterin-6-yl-methyl-4-(beta-D-ribofuranosyl)aminobenzene 5'-phosphate synthase